MPPNPNPNNSSSVSTFPPDIATILNEPSDNGFRQSLREYQSDLSSTARAAHPSVSAPEAPEGMQVDGGGDGNVKEKDGGEDSRFMARTYNLLTASQGDLGEMMDEYSIYPE